MKPHSSLGVTVQHEPEVIRGAGVGPFHLVSLGSTVYLVGGHECWLLSAMYMVY